MPLPTAPFNAALSIAAGLSVIQLKVLPSFTGVTAATDTLTFGAAHNLVVGQQLQYNSGTGWTGLTAGTGYFVVAVPTTTTAKISATVGGAAITVGTSSLGSFTPVSVFEAGKMEHKDEREYGEIRRPDRKGVSRLVRRWVKTGKESFVFPVDEAKRLPNELFGGGLAGLTNVTATIWEPDPSDASGKVALKSDTDFPCDVTRDGSMTFGDGNATIPMIVITSLKAGDVLFTADATA